AAGLEKRAAAITCTGAAAAAAAVAGTAWAGGGAIPVAWAALIVSGALLAFATFYLAHVARAAPHRLFAPVLRPFAAASLMLVLVRLGQPHTGSTFADLMIEVVAGAAAYVFASWLLWAAAGRPAGAEAEAMKFAGRVRMPLRWRRRSAAGQP
ncbi:MAG TPA: hypothetical protein VGX37_09040, partial [Allosphingosinicella sp.]|nr:hypothetical protein [Allosphingosinicella sp.]